MAMVSAKYILPELVLGLQLLRRRGDETVSLPEESPSLPVSSFVCARGRILAAAGAQLGLGRNVRNTPHSHVTPKVLGGQRLRNVRNSPCNQDHRKVLGGALVGVLAKVLPTSC